jgi:NAD(P)-dependent dehydrogenase (short-subunit alcohol dehydrogenase family)
MNIGVSPCAAGKAGASGFMRHLAIENAKHGVTVNTISLGLVLDDPGMVEALPKTIPVGRMGTPTDVGALAVYLASDEASWPTGQTIGLNGGAITSQLISNASVAAASCAAGQRRLPVRRTRCQQVQWTRPA